MTAQTFASWPAWSCTVTVGVTSRRDLRRARAAVTAELAAMDLAASRFRTDSELSRVNSATVVEHRVSPLLAEAVRVALDAARLTDGLVDPGLESRLVQLGYDRDIDQVRHGSAGRTRSGRPPRTPDSPTWRDVRLDGQRLLLPHGVRLDLGATAKALTADRAVRRVATETGEPALVSVGGDVATTGGAAWDVLVSERPDDTDPAVVRVHDGGLATSSVLARRWSAGGRVRHHLLDPRTGDPVDGPWRTVTVAARTCVAANTASTAALVLGVEAAGWLADHGLPARLVADDGAVHTVAGWPQDGAAA